MKTMKLTASPAAKARFERLGPAHKPAAEPLDPAATAAVRNAQREQNKRVREILASRYPALFGSAQPLAVGIWEELWAAAGDVPEPELQDFLRFWTRRLTYRKALAREGARRVHLDGTDAGPADIADRLNRLVAAALKAAKGGHSAEDELRAAMRERDPEAPAELIGMALRRAGAQLQRGVDLPTA